MVFRRYLIVGCLDPCSLGIRFWGFGVQAVALDPDFQAQGLELIKDLGLVFLNSPSRTGSRKGFAVQGVAFACFDRLAFGQSIPSFSAVEVWICLKSHSPPPSRPRVVPRSFAATGA